MSIKSSVQEAVFDGLHPPQADNEAWHQRRAQRIQAEHPKMSYRDALLQASKDARELRDKAAKIDRDVRREALAKSDGELDRRARAIMQTKPGVRYAEALVQASREIA